MPAFQWSPVYRPQTDELYFVAGDNHHQYHSIFKTISGNLQDAALIYHDDQNWLSDLAFLPNGTGLIFSRRAHDQNPVTGLQELFLSAPDGSNLQPLTEDGLHAFSPSTAESLLEPSLMRGTDTDR